MPARLKKGRRIFYQAADDAEAVAPRRESHARLMLAHFALQMIERSFLYVRRIRDDHGKARLAGFKRAEAIGSDQGQTRADVVSRRVARGNAERGP